MSKLSKNKNKNQTYNNIYLHYIEPQIKIDNFEFVHVDKFDKVKKESVQEIFILDLLEYNIHNNNIILIQKCIDKLKAGGKLHIQGFDITAMCYGIVYGKIDINVLKNIIFGANKNNIYSIEQVKQLLANNYGSILEIQKIKFLNGLQYYIECQKISHE